MDFFRNIFERLSAIVGTEGAAFAVAAMIAVTFYVCFSAR